MTSTQWAATERTPAQVTLAEGITLEGDVHLQPSTAFHDTRETPLEMLNRAELFFPLSRSGGDLLFLAKAQVVSVTFLGPAVQDPERESAVLRIGLEVTLSGGAELRGFAATELPPNRCRASDYLNEPERFFSLVVGETTVCVNRAHVRSARPLT